MWEQHCGSLIKEVLPLNSPLMSISKSQLKVRKELKSKLGIVASERAIHFFSGDFVSNEFSIDNNVIREMLKY